MNYFLFFLGLTITTLAVIDLIYTVLSPNGAGLITGKYSRWSWRLLLWCTGFNGKSRLLNYAGVIILFSLILFWVVLIWLGNTLTFYADEEALDNPSTGQFVTSFFDKLYYTGYVLSSMGNGDFSPTTNGWKFYVGFISYTGVIYMSLSISFLIPVVEAVTLKRQVAISIAELGKNPRHILRRHCEGNNTSSLVEKVYPLRNNIIKLAQNHMTYPIIHYFHSTNKYESLPLFLVALDETISILLYGFDEIDPDSRRALEELNMATTFYLTTLESAFIDPGDDEPTRPEDSDYPENVTLSSHQEIRDAYRSLSNRRKLLLAYLQNDGWAWEDMAENEEGIQLSV